MSRTGGTKHSASGSSNGDSSNSGSSNGSSNSGSSGNSSEEGSPLKVRYTGARVTDFLDSDQDNATAAIRNVFVSEDLWATLCNTWNKSTGKHVKQPRQIRKDAARDFSETVRQAFYVELRRSPWPSLVHFPHQENNGTGCYNEVYTAEQDMIDWIPSLLKQTIEKEEHVAWMIPVGKPLPDRNSCKPDFVAVQKTPIATIRIGVFQHDSGRSTMATKRHCLRHMSSLLYYFRVQCGIPLESVYGFGYCSPNYKVFNGKRYAIGLFKLSAPKHLGGLATSEECWGYFESSSKDGIQLLLFYLAHGKVWDMPVALSHVNATVRRCPAFLDLPMKFWSDDSPNRELQRNCTKAILFQVNSVGLNELLDELKKENPTIGFPVFANKTRQHAAENTRRRFYVKIRTSCTNLHLSFSDMSYLYGAATWAVSVPLDKTDSKDISLNETDGN